MTMPVDAGQKLFDCVPQKNNDLKELIENIRSHPVTAFVIESRKGFPNEHESYTSCKERTTPQSLKSGSSQSTLSLTSHAMGREVNIK